MPRGPATSVPAQRRSLRVLRAEYLKRKGDLREMVVAKKAIMAQLRAKITKLEEEILGAHETLSQEFDSGSSLFATSDSESSSSDKAEAPSETPATKAKAAPSKKTDGATGQEVKNMKEKEGKKPPKAVGREQRPRLPPGAPAPNHRGKPNSQGVLYPGFAQSDPRYCDACEQLRRGFPSATKAHRPKDGPCQWAPLAKK